MEKHYLKISSFPLESGILLKNVEVEYHLYGKKSSNKTIWICHALTANSDPFEWWPNICGNSGFYNPKDHFIVCANILGSCYGTTGPLSKDENGDVYFDEFPTITIRDMANLHEQLRLHLQIDSIHTLIGASLGGQQALEWAILQPKVFERLILIATNARHSPYGIAFNESQRLAIEADTTYYSKTINGGRSGLIAARSIALLSYRSYNGYLYTQEESDFDKINQFKAAHYQRYQGVKLADRFNAYSYVTLTKAMDTHNVARGRGSFSIALGRIQAKTLIIGITSDQLFPISEQLFLYRNIEDSEFRTINSSFGHDGFLIEYEAIIEHISNFYQLDSSKKNILKPPFQEYLFTA
ncbi:MAG: homoserine O-acetyltransferase [Bacteroidota bacterium]|jgi:homoserine O-acetyltransferase